MAKKYGFIDKSGKVVIEPQFDHARDFSEGFAQVIKGGKWVFEDEMNKMVIKDGKSGSIDKSGKVVIEPSYQKKGKSRQFNRIYPFSEGLAQVEKNDKYGFIDKSGKVVIEPQFDGAGNFSEGFARVAIES